MKGFDLERKRTNYKLTLRRIQAILSKDPSKTVREWFEGQAESVQKLLDTLDSDDGTTMTAEEQDDASIEQPEANTGEGTAEEMTPMDTEADDEATASRPPGSSN